jgi:DNA-binding Lrp family transcriptional regulator
MTQTLTPVPERGEECAEHRRNRAASYDSMVESFSLTELDRALLHALDLDGRASFARIGEVLGVSAHTVARRYQRLRGAGISVVGALEPLKVGRVTWFTRIHTVPEAAGSVATALARRDDTAWISLASGGTEILCGVHTRSDSHRDELLLGKLPHTPQVVSVSAHYALHEFTRSPGAPKSWLQALTGDQVAALRPERGDDGGPIELTETDQAMLDVLARDGRASYTELAAAAGSSESAMRRRLGWLTSSGALAFSLTIDPAQLGHPVNVTLWLTVAPAELESVGAAIAAHPEVPFAAATTGPSNLVASAWFPDTEGLYRYLTDRIGSLPGVRQVETAPTVRTVKRAG